MPPEQRTFTLQGQIQSLDGPRKQVTVKHEEIKGFMPAMTMPYEVEEARALDGLAPGDLINAQLIVFANGAHLTAIKKVGSAPLEKAPADVPNSTTHAFAVLLFCEVEVHTAVGGASAFSVSPDPATMPVPLVTVNDVALVIAATFGGVAVGM